MTIARDTEADEQPVVAQNEPCAKPLSPLLQMAGVTKRFGTTTALNQVDLEVRAGEIHAILGENGAGKSTLMHLLSGLMRPDSGEIRKGERRLALTSPRRARELGVAMVHQHFTLVPAFSVAENLALDTPPSGGIGAAFRGYGAREAAASALERAKALGWELDPDARIAALPVGTQQRVEIVKALATDADILIFDEPTAVLAEAEVGELFQVLRRLRDEGKAVLLIAHKLAEILAVADRVTVLRRGRRVASVPIADVTADKLAQWMVRGATEATNAAPESAPELAFQPVSQRPPSPALEKAPALTATRLTVRGDRGETALRELSLSVRRGEIFGIGGVDGNGQTELAEALAGLRPLNAGSLRWEDADFAPGVAPRVGYIPQDRRHDGLAVTMTIEENLLFDAVRERPFRRGLFLKRRALRQLANRLAQQFDVRTDSIQRPAASLSGGNQQKIVVARALRSNPDLIVAMNPTRGLDIGATRFVHEQLLQARERGAVVLLISTDFDEVRALSDRAAILSQGRLSDFALHAADDRNLGRMLGGMQSAPATESADA